jgi:PKD domain
MLRRLLGWMVVLVLIPGTTLFGPGVALAALTNDNFANATPITALPFTDTVDISTATLEPGEPAAPSCGFGMTRTVWYTFTPAASGSVLLKATGTSSAAVDAYRGTSLTSLVSLGCGQFGNGVAIGLTAGTTYYFQVGPQFEQTGTITFSVSVAPPPVVAFDVVPSDPSIFDVVNFNDNSNDPGFARFATSTWDFGDGQTGNGFFVTHQYAADGDYTMTHVATTVDGRSGTVAQVLHVKTHDVAIAGFDVPRRATVGDTERITVDVISTRYPETVRVTLSRSVGGTSFASVGELTQAVPAGPRPTRFGFDYTFTPADATLGKVSFQAIADVVGARDALPIDNGVQAPITIVEAR